MLLLILRIEISSDEWLGLYINIVSIFTTFFMRNILASLFALVSKKRGVSVCVIVIFCIVLFDAVLEYKRNWEILADDFLIITVFGCLIVVLSYYWQLEREKVHIQEIELRLHNLYDSSFKEMIQVMQEKQHDFHNHIQAIKSQHYTIHTYEELVKEQEKYCDYMIKDNKFFHLLNSNSSVLTGFLYGKFIEADKDEIEVRYSVRVGHHIEELPEYILIEIIGVLWDNAVEAVKEHGDKVIVINIRKNEEPLLLEVGNPIFDVSYAELQRFFKRGYSNKEAHSGIGLHKLYQYSEKYGYNLIVDKGKQEGKDWLFIKISFEAVHTLK